MPSGTGAFAVTFWGMLPDTVEYGEWKSGIRLEATIFGLVTFAQKGAVALSAVLLGFLLDVIGYRAGQVQSAETLDGLRLVIVLVPLVGIAASALCMVFYPLSPKRHADIVQREYNDKARCLLKTWTRRLALVNPLCLCDGGELDNSEKLASKNAYLAALPRAVSDIVVILFDDLGYGDVLYGNRSIRTPYMDALAENGVVMTNIFSPAPVCSPSRAAMLTGRMA